MTEQWRTTDQIDCPWCSAKVGEPCYSQVRALGRRGYETVRDARLAHLARSVPESEYAPINPPPELAVGAAR